MSVEAEAATLPLDDYLSGLAAGLQGLVEGGGRTRFVAAICDPYPVTPEIAVCFGMIVNELVSNACKYAYDPGTCGEIRVRLVAHGDGGFTLTVEDDGEGVEGCGGSRSTGIGTRLVVAMARRLGAEFRFVAGRGGARATVSCEARTSD